MSLPGQAGVADRPLLVMQGVDKSFASGTRALAGFDLVIGSGEFVSLLGPSGCGKSTVLRLMARLARASAGRIDWPQGELAGRIGFVFQEPTLLPWATVAANDWLPLRLQGRSRHDAHDEVMQTLALVGLDGFAHAYPRELSGGMRMRVSIARALVTRPRLLLMDEPFAALDEITRIRLNNDLLRLWQAQGWTVVFVTHSVYESVYLSSRVVVMAAGPGRVAAEIAIEAPYPRDEAFRTSAVYNEHCRAASAALHRAMGE